MASPTREVATRESNLPAVPDGYLENFPEGHDEADHILPVVSIVQPTSGEEKLKLGTPGQFVARDGTAYDTLRFVLVSVEYGRGLARPFEGHDKANEGSGMWLCYSDNRKAGRPSDVQAVFGDKQPDFQFDEAGLEVIDCMKCPRSADNKNWKEGGCRYTYTLRCWDLEANRPFAFYVKGAAMSPVRAAIIDRVTPREGASGLYVEKPFWWAELEFATALKQGKGSYYVPVPRVVRELDVEEQAQYVAAYRTLREAKIEEPLEDEAQQAAFDGDES